MLKEITTGI